MPMNRHLYPLNWHEISTAIRQRAGGKCEWCGAEAGRPHPSTGSLVVLTVAHIDHVPAHIYPSNLVALCQRCHLRHDVKQHMQNAALTRRQQKINAGQLVLGGF